MNSPIVRTLGQCAVNGTPVRSRRAVELVTVLALAGGSAPRDWLLANLFEGDPAPSSLPTLALRARKLGLDVRYHGDRFTYQLESWVECDVVELLARIDEGRIADALALYRGPFLPRSQSPFAVEIRASVESRTVSAAVRTGDPAVMAAADRVIKHPALSAALLRESGDTAAVSLSRSWLARLETAI
ncbi:hypothetical protein GCM10007079_49390 [Nocardiopsis terrae]|uniref:Uncharacterized protein n=1 Tax=Nocardiopsis terrae TaxID=372655 RepID=A0ABR9HA73_9ACTN|nr:hypothetical protein [Nocardiopsis terrae]MBE1455944.1 hypothetical protein [Nocardiopsis terrae]GHC96575.1 hypothetical protein GCM10007079_49390 [Nocardiopsis terrae]